MDIKDKKFIIKTGVKLVGGIGTDLLVWDIVNTVMPPEAKAAGRVVRAIGGVCVSGAVSEILLDKPLDMAIDTCEEIKKTIKNRKKSVKVETV